MVELVSTAIVQETVSQILSGLVQKYEDKEESNEKRNLERLEMAHIRLEAALETSNKWQITDASLLCWRRKLKRAVEDCDDTLHKCKQRILEDEQMEREVSLPVYRKQKTSLSEDLIYLQDCTYLKVGISFSPHGSLEDMLPANRSSEISAIVHMEQHLLHTDITLEQLVEIMLPKAIDYFCHNIEETVYKMLWKSKHGFALIQFEKPSMSTWRSSMRRWSTSGGAMKRKLFQGHDEELIWSRIHLCHWLDSWFTHVPIRLQRSVKNWIRKEKEILVAAPQLHLNF